jgi:hypothetical protein
LRYDVCKLVRATGWIARMDRDGYEGAAAAAFRFGFGGATGQLLPGLGPGPLAPGAEHPEVAIKVMPRPTYTFKICIVWEVRGLLLAMNMCVAFGCD